MVLEGETWWSRLLLQMAEAVSTSRRALRAVKIPESEFVSLPNGLKYYDLKVGSGLQAVKGTRVAVHYVAKWRGITFMTSRQGLGVGGGTIRCWTIGEWNSSKGIRSWCARHACWRPEVVDCSTQPGLWRQRSPRNSSKCNH